MLNDRVVKKKKIIQLFALTRQRNIGLDGYRLLADSRFSCIFLLCILDLDIYQNKLKYNMSNIKKNIPKGCITGLSTLKPRMISHQAFITYGTLIPKKLIFFTDLDNIRCLLSHNKSHH